MANVDRVGRAGAIACAVVAVAGTLAFIWLDDLGEVARIAILAVAVVAHLVLVLRRPAAGALQPALVLGLAVLAVVGAVAAVPRGTDLWAYQMYGRIVVVHDASPYEQPPEAFPDDPVLPRMQGSWVGVRSEYGPALVGLTVVTARVAGESELAGRLIWQGLCGAAVLAAVVLVGRRTRSAVAMAALGLNPLVIYQLVHLAHNDALIGLLVLGAVLLARDQRDVAAALLLVVGALIKAPVGIALVALLVWVLVRRGPRRAAVAGGTAALAGVAALVAAGGTAVLEPMLGARGRTNGFAPWNLFRGGGVIFTGTSMPDLPLESSRLLATVAVATAAGLAAALALVHTWRPGPDDATAADDGGAPPLPARLDPTQAVLAALAAWTLLSLYTSPWSFGWLLPLAALHVRSWLARGLLVYVGLFAVTAQWGILTVASLWLEDPAFGVRDDVNAVLRSVLLLTLLALVVALVVDGARRARATPPRSAEEPDPRSTDGEPPVPLPSGLDGGRGRSGGARAPR